MITTQRKRKTRGSAKAEAVAHAVVKRIQNKQSVNVKELMVTNGYSLASARAQKVTKTSTFQDIVSPVIERMESLHAKAIDNLASRDLTTERMDSVVNLAKQMVHDTRLLQDKSTHNVGINVVVYGEGDVLARHLKGTVPSADTEEQHNGGTLSSPSSETE